MGAHFLAIKDMAGLCRPYAASALVKALEGGDRPADPFPHARHERRERGLRAAGQRRAAWTSSTWRSPRCRGSHQPAEPEFHRRRAAAHAARHRGSTWRRSTNFPITGSRCGRSTRRSTPRPSSGTAEVYLHEMPGGQYTNLKEQAAAMGLGHRWPRDRALLCGGEPALRRHRESHAQQQGRGRHGDVPHHARHQAGGCREPRARAPRFPESVIDMLTGGLGEPARRLARKIVKAVTGKGEPQTARAGAGVDLKAAKADLAAKLKREVTDDDLYSHLMYPQVFVEFARLARDFGDVGVAAHARLFLRPQAGRGNFGEHRGGQGALHQAHQRRRAGQGGPPHDLL